MKQQFVADPSLWLDAPLPDFAPLRSDIEVDVCIVGGGVTGITTAYLLRDRLAPAEG